MEEMEERKAKEEKERILEKNEVSEPPSSSYNLHICTTDSWVGCGGGIDSIAVSIFR